MGKRIRCRDEDSGVEAEVRKECLRKKLRQAETERQSPKVIEEFEAKRDLKSEAEIEQIEMKQDRVSEPIPRLRTSAEAQAEVVALVESVCLLVLPRERL